MTRVSVEQIASYLIKQPECHFSNTFDGNMKLQKLLVFANLIHFVKHSESLFTEEMFAFKNGIVVEDVRVPFYYNYSDYIVSLQELPNPDFSEQQFESINMSISLFNKLSATELSDLHHEFETWKIKFRKSCIGNSYDKRLSVIKNEEILETDLAKMKKIIDSYTRNQYEQYASEKVNGITFYYDLAELEKYLDKENMLNYLEDISRSVVSGEDDTFFLAYDEQQGIYYY